MRLERLPQLRWSTLGFAVLIVSCALANSACSNGGDDVEEASDRMRDDVVWVAEAVSAIAEPGEVRHLGSCRNDGSGPIPPMTRVDLQLAEGATIDEAVAAVEVAMADLGYDAVAAAGSVLLVGRRQLDDRWGGEMRLYQSYSTRGELVLGTALTPRITC